MQHPEDSELNEYLDGALPPGERARLEAHLAACSACKARLAELENLFAALRDLPEEAVGRDLSGRVQAAIRPAVQPAYPAWHRWRLGIAMLAAQTLAGFALAILAWQPGLLQNLLATTRGAAGLAASPLQNGLNGLAAQAAQLQMVWQGFQVGLAALPGAINERWPAVMASIPLEPILIGLGAAGLGWLAANILLLKPKSR
jgi:anti-sigma factor RsiW